MTRNNRTALTAAAGGPHGATAGGAIPGVAGTPDTRPPPGVARSATAGGEDRYAATAGGSHAGVAGPTGATPTQEILQLDGRYVVSLRAADGEVRNETEVTNFDAVREHTAISDWEVEVPFDQDLEEWRFADVVVSFGTSVVFRGRLEEIEGSETDATTKLAGRGPGWRLSFGDVTVRYRGVAAWRAIEDFWKEHTDFSATVFQPSDSRTIDDREFSGTPLDILQELHEDYNLRFVTDHRSPSMTAETFPKEHVERGTRWITTDATRSREVYEYANSVIVRGARREDRFEGERFEATATDEEEIAQKGEEIIWRETDPDLETVGDCRERAQALLDDHVSEDEVSGSHEIVPQMVKPGPRVPVDRWDTDRVVGPYAMSFDSSTEDCLEIDPAMMHGMAQGGTVAFWARMNFDEGVTLPTAFGTRHGDGVASEMGIRSGREIGLAVSSRSGGLSTVPADPDSEIDSLEWALIHWGWSYDRRNDTTTVHGGHGGEWLSADQLSGRLIMPDQAVTVGCWRDDYYSGGLDDVRFYERHVHDEIEDLAAGREIPGDDLRARYTFREGPEADVSMTTDVIGGWHGTFSGSPTFTGNPLAVEQVTLQESAGEASGEISFEQAADIGQSLADLQTEQRSIKQTI